MTAGHGGGDPGPADAGSEPPPPRFWPLFALFAAEVLALTAWSTPGERFTRFAYCDSGTDLTIQALLGRGLRPTVDFGYIYGLLPLLINRIWQGVFGPTPAACRGAILVANLATAWGLARFASTLRVGRAGVALVVVALPDVLLTSTFVLVHALEQALLVNALAFQARGRRGVALALATACLFVKPSMAYLYGLVLLTAAAAAGPSRLLRAMTPAALTGLVLGCLLAADFGAGPVVNSLLPGKGMEVYRESRHGFFRGAGREFWVIPGGGLRDYFRYEVGSWLIGASLLTGAGVLAAARVVRRRGSRNDEMVLTCALLHAAFVLLFFGNRWSWVYYYAVLILGLAATAARDRRHALVVAALAALVLVGGKVKFEMTARLWRADRPAAATFGLWASPAERAEWETVLALARERPPAVLLAGTEGAAFLAPDVFEPPAVSYLVRGHTVPPEVRRKAEQIARAGTVVVARPKGDPGRGGYDSWPEIAAALDGCEVIFQGDLFRVERRVRPPTAASTPPGPG